LFNIKCCTNKLTGSLTRFAHQRAFFTGSQTLTGFRLLQLVNIFFTDIGFASVPAFGSNFALACGISKAAEYRDLSQSRRPALSRNPGGQIPPGYSQRA
jgi:hypothetical protein